MTLLQMGDTERIAANYNHGGRLGNAWLTVLPMEHGHCLADAAFVGAVRRRLGLLLRADGEDKRGHVALTNTPALTRQHNRFVDRLVEHLNWLGGVEATNLDRPVADMSGTPFATLPRAKRPDIRIVEAGYGTTYIDISYSHWWSTGSSSTSTQRRMQAAASPTGSVQRAWERKLREYSGQRSWPGCELVLGVISTGGRAHDTFVGFLRGLCVRAAARRGYQDSLPPAAVAAGFLHRIFGLLSVEVNRAMLTVLAEHYGLLNTYPRREAEENTPFVWESVLAADAVGDYTESDRDATEATARANQPLPGWGFDEVGATRWRDVP